MKRRLFKTESVIFHKNNRHHYLIENDGEKTPLTSGEFAEILEYNRINYLLNKFKQKRK